MLFFKIGLTYQDETNWAGLFAYYSKSLLMVDNCHVLRRLSAIMSCPKRRITLLQQQLPFVTRAIAAREINKNEAQAISNYITQLY